MLAVSALALALSAGEPGRTWIAQRTTTMTTPAPPASIPPTQAVFDRGRGE